MEKLKVGIVGMNRGAKHTYIAQFDRNIIVSAVCDIVPEKAKKVAEDFHIPRYYGNIEDMLADADIDAVLVASPIDNHVDHVVLSLQAGKHVLSEVTAATMMPDLERLRQAVKASDKVYMMAENYVYFRPLSILRRMIDEGLLGEIYYAEGDYLKDFEYNPHFPHFQGWRASTYFGRRGHPYITHSLGPISTLMHERVSKVVGMGAGRHACFVADYTCALMCQTENGHMIRLRNSFISPRPDNYLYYSFQGTKGCFQGAQGPTDFHKVHIRGLCKPNEWRNIYDFAGFEHEDWHRLDSMRYFNKTGYDSGTPIMHEAFARSVLRGEAPPIPLEDALNWTAAGLLSEQSVNENGMPVEVPVYR